MDMGVIHQEGKPVVIFFQIGQLNDLWNIIRMFHIVHLKGGEVAGYNPARIHIVRQTCGIAAGLLVRREFHPVALAVPGVQIHVGAFLLNQDLGGCDVGINEVGTLLFCDGLDRNFKLHHFHRVVDTEDRVQQ